MEISLARIHRINNNKFNIIPAAKFTIIIEGSKRSQINRNMQHMLNTLILRKLNNLRDSARTKHGDWKVMTMHDNFHYILSVEPYTFFLCSQLNPTPFFFTSIYCQSNPIPFFFASKGFSASFIPQWSITLTNKITEHTQTNRQHTII